MGWKFCPVRTWYRRLVMRIIFYFRIILPKRKRPFPDFPKRMRRYTPFDAYLNEAANIVRKLLWETPIDPSKRNWKTFRDGASLLWRHRKIGNKMYRIVDMMTMSAYDFLKEWFEDDRIMAVIAYYASIGTFAGPKSPGSAYVIMHHVMGEHEGVALGIHQGWHGENHRSTGKLRT